jgi:tripartite-type tricarboxylate transporter receptor subunit TctC
LPNNNRSILSFVGEGGGQGTDWDKGGRVPNGVKSKSKGGKKMKKGRVILSWASLLFSSVMFTTILITGAANAADSDWPSGDITIIVPYNPGGGYDLVARATAASIPKHLPKKANVVVKNVPGAGGKIGLREMVKSKPNGLTLGVFDPMEIEIMKKGGQLEGLDIDNMQWLGRMDRLPDILLVGPKAGIQKPADARGKTIKFAGLGSAVVYRSFLMGERLGAKVQIVNYDGVPDAALSAVRGDIDAVLINWASSMRQVRATNNQLIPVFVDTDERVPGLAVPTAKELGIKLEEGVMGDTHTLAGPPGLSAEVRKMWGDTLEKVFKDEEWFERMNKIGFPPGPVSGDKLNTMIDAIRANIQRNMSIVSRMHGGK